MIKRAIARGSIQHEISNDLNAFAKLILNPSYARQIDRNEILKAKRSISSYFDNYNVTLFPYARTALHAVLKSLDIPKGSKVLMTPINIGPMLNIIESLDLHVDFVDVNLVDFGPNYIHLEDKLAESPSCLFLTYLFGYVPDVEVIVNLCKKYNVRLIEDISQSIGSKFDKKLLGTFGSAAIYSASLTKYVDGYNGAFAITNSASIYKSVENYQKKLNNPDKNRIRGIVSKTLLWNILLNKHIFNIFTYRLLSIISIFKPKLFKKLLGPSISLQKSSILPGFYFESITNLQSITIRKYLGKLDILISKRRLYAKIVLTAIKEIGLTRDIYNSYLEKERYNNYWQFVIEVKDIDLAKELLFKNGIETGNTNLPNLSISCNQNLRNANRLKNNFIFIPMHEHLDINDYKNIFLLLETHKLIVIDDNFLKRISIYS
ncbi:DegT/DnrJ/EryC1/StrS family aminotransferase [Prochlorococcus marinus]|uniref:DegT/DnrJ/EryC1/StrS family aminotransferase n=1 Tax=Prochlorococcus marinus TaxID=1219 RepID=UPI0022B370D9|nr:DegT/DnrJ/EryC1/StrS family aminotransferase [Prochlorococcus marinus]